MGRVDSTSAGKEYRPGDWRQRRTLHWVQPGVDIPSEKDKVFRSSVDIESLKTLENLARRLSPPQWPSVFRPSIENWRPAAKTSTTAIRPKGFQNLCAHCHVPAKSPTRPTTPQVSRSRWCPSRNWNRFSLSGELFPTHRGHEFLRPRTDFCKRSFGICHNRITGREQCLERT